MNNVRTADGSNTEADGATLEPLQVRMDDVAQLAKVSRATVSRVLVGHPPVSDATREKVLNAVLRAGLCAQHDGTWVFSPREFLSIPAGGVHELQLRPGARSLAVFRRRGS